MKIKNKSNKVVGIPAFKIENGTVIREKGNIPLLPDCVMEIPDEFKQDIGTLVDMGFVAVAKKQTAHAAAETEAPVEAEAPAKKEVKSGKRANKQ